MTKIQLLNIRGTDNLATPSEAAEIIAPYVKGTVWECAAGGGAISRVLKNRGKVVESDKDDDFLSGYEPNQWDCIVTNPPFSLKDKFIERCYEHGKPFALLLPITALEGKKRQAMYREHGIQVMPLPKRIDFTGKKSPWFAVGWFCWKLLPRDLMFIDEK